MLWLDILLTITVLGLAKDWFICCGGFIVDHCCLSYDRGVVHIVVAGYIVDNYCFMFDRGVVDIVVSVLLLNIIISGLTEECFILLWLVILSTITV